MAQRWQWAWSRILLPCAALFVLIVGECALPCHAWSAGKYRKCCIPVEIDPERNLLLRTGRNFIPPAGKPAYVRCNASLAYGTPLASS